MSRHIFRDFIDAMATVAITTGAVEVYFQKRTLNPLLLAAGFDKTDVPVPWLGNKRLRLRIGKLRERHRDRSPGCVVLSQRA